MYKDDQQHNLSSLSGIIHESELPFSLDYSPEVLVRISRDMPDIMPKLPEYLEQIRKEHRIRTSFDLYDGMLSQMKTIPAPMQLFLINELIETKKPMPHEIAVMMLLHQNVTIRKQIAVLFQGQVSKETFTPLDLRRLIVIRNWLPDDERDTIDELIKSIRKTGVSPLPYPGSRVNAILASAFDGAGAQLIFFEAKQKSQRIIGGFIVKQGIGIREPWVETKAAKGQFEEVCNGCDESTLKPVSSIYVKKAVQHFIAEGHKLNKAPSPYLLQIAEIMGAKEWQANAINVEQELALLREKMDFDLSDKYEIAESLERSEAWSYTEPFFQTWFECGENAQKALEQAVEKHKQLNDDKVSLGSIATKEIVGSVLEKWKKIMLFMCLWARSKKINEPLWKDILVVLEQLMSEKVLLEDIPVIQNIASQSAAVMTRRNTEVRN